MPVSDEAGVVLPYIEFSTRVQEQKQESTMKRLLELFTRKKRGFTILIVSSGSDASVQRYRWTETPVKRQKHTVALHSMFTGS